MNTKICHFPALYQFECISALHYYITTESFLGYKKHFPVTNNSLTLSGFNQNFFVQNSKIQL